jgi:hypothetical protein
MKNIRFEKFFSFFGLLLMAFGVSALILLGIMFMPLVVIVIFFLACRQIIIWKRKKRVEPMQV